MTILIVNDDGITAKGIEKLAKAATKFADVYVVAPASQCSAMSQRITINANLSVEEVDFPVPVKGAYAIGGTPADCVKVALNMILDKKPDYVFSGINFGYNVGFDVRYSGTVGAAMEGLMYGVPSAAFSNDFGDCYDTVDRYLEEIIAEIIKADPLEGSIWNVNFPAIKAGECKGILRDRKLAPLQIIMDNYSWETDENGKRCVHASGIFTPIEKIPDETDAKALYQNYISIGTIKCEVL